MLIIREKLAGLYESEQQWSKAAQMLSGIDLDSGMRSESKLLSCCCYYYYFYSFKEVIVMNILFFSFFVLIIFYLDASIRVIDDTFRLSKCVQIARLYLEVLALFCKYNLLIEMILLNFGALRHYWTHYLFEMATLEQIIGCVCVCVLEAPTREFTYGVLGSGGICIGNCYFGIHLRGQ